MLDLTQFQNCAKLIFYDLESSWLRTSHKKDKNYLNKLRFEQRGTIREYVLNLKLSGTNKCCRLSVQALFILVDTSL